MIAASSSVAVGIEVVATAAGAASLGHPAAAVAWMVRTMAAEDDGLAAG